MGLKPNLTDKWRCHLSQSRNNGLFSDIKISCSDGSDYPAHKLVMGVQWFLEKDAESDVLILEGFNSEVVKTFLDILYSGLTKFTGEEHLRDLKELAQLFGVRNLSLETFVFEEDFEEEDELYYESDESEDLGVKSHGSLTVTLEENLSKRDILAQDRVFVCPRCGEGFGTNLKLEAHEKVHEDEEEDEYDEDEDPMDEDDVKVKFKREHNVHACKYCNGSSFSSKAELDKHLFVIHADARCCRKCGKEFKESKSLNYHSKYVCPKIKREFFKCRVCESKFPSPRDARRHEKSLHGNPRIHRCPQCNVVCKSSSFLSNHIKVAHNPENLRFKCPTCGKAFLKTAYLKDHINRFHVAEKQFECSNCSKKFSTKQDLQKHSKLHEGSKHECNFCGESFTYRSTLTQHIRSTHTGDKPYKCRPCNKNFGFLEVLKKHKKSHDRKGDATIIVTAPKGQKGIKSYIDFSPNVSSAPIPHNPQSSSYLPQPPSASTSTTNAFSTNICQDIVHYENQQVGSSSNPSFPHFSNYPKSETVPDQITTIDIMELLSKN